MRKVSTGEMGGVSMERGAATGKNLCGLSAALSLTAVKGGVAAKTNDVEAAPVTVATIQMVILAANLICFLQEWTANKTITAWPVHIVTQTWPAANALASLVTVMIPIIVYAIVPCVLDILKIAKTIFSTEKAANLTLVAESSATAPNGVGTVFTKGAKCQLNPIGAGYPIAGGGLTPTGIPILILLGQKGPVAAVGPRKDHRATALCGGVRQTNIGQEHAATLVQQVTQDRNATLLLLPHSLSLPQQQPGRQLQSPLLPRAPPPPSLEQAQPLPLPLQLIITVRI